MKKMGLILCLVLALAVSGCSSVQRFAAIGAGAGAITGGVWAANAPTLNALEGTAIGAAGGGLVGALAGSVVDYNKTEKIKAELENANRELDATKKALEACQARCKELEGRLTDKGIEYTILESVLFVPGSNKLSKEGMETLASLSESIKKDHPGKKLKIEGHTDNQPIRYSKWQSNWELGAGRALAVLHFMLDKQGMDATLVSATTYGEFSPQAPNDNDEGKAKNRRVTIIVANK